ncbi:hypothetical protein HAZT_HAZT001514 [Hyalella azteca]|uniref:LRRNT domain-containing protein n=1 Tax=Hyalella azteca TaxID=294128 RepID=A0A6A0GWW0_HYAAZ|nr:hypothetical protein HAZT_HAZT001514 [Hyalella azteca]
MALELDSESLVGMPHLESLQLGRNNIWTLPERVFCPLPALRHLNLTWNRLQDVSEVGVTGGCGAHLITLDLSGNDLVMLPEAGLAGLESLKELYLQYNEISMMADGSLVGLNSLNVLNMSSNRLVALPPEIFNETLALQQLYLQNNSLSVLAPGLFSSLTELTLLDLSHNQLTSEWVTRFLTKLKNLQHLDLSNNVIRTLCKECLSGLSEVEVLDLSMNELTAIPHNSFDTNQGLKIMRLDGNKIGDVNALFAALPNLMWLNVSDNRITWFDYALIPAQLEYLDLQHNRITELGNYYTIQKELQLKTLDASHNFIEKLGPTSVPDSIQFIVRFQKVVSKKCGLKLFPPEPAAIPKEDDKAIIYDAFVSHSDLDAKTLLLFLTIIYIIITTITITYPNSEVVPSSTNINSRLP